MFMLPREEEPACGSIPTRAMGPCSRGKRALSPSEATNEEPSTPMAGRDRRRVPGAGVWRPAWGRVSTTSWR